jgi:hypothetical protein
MNPSDGSAASRNQHFLPAAGLSVALRLANRIVNFLAVNAVILFLE